MVLVNWLVSQLRPHIDELAVAIIATALVIFGDHINELLRFLVKRRPLWLRLTAFVALCTLGYGAIAVWLTPVLERFLRGLPGWQMLLVVVTAFIALALLAQKQRKI